MAIGVGLIGANPEAGWAFRAHVPALQFLQQTGHDVRIAAVSTTRAESAQRAAALTGARGYTSAADLAADPEVDLAVVTVKVPAHDELVRAALAGGIHVLSEWPLALDSAEAAGLAAAAAEVDRRVFVGLQARFDPAATALREAIAAGRLGRLQAVAVRSSRVLGRGALPAEFAYILDRNTGAGAREVATGHLLDLLDQTLGGIEVLSGNVTRFRRAAEVAGSGTLAATAPDTVHALFTGSGPHGSPAGSLMLWDGDAAPSTEIVVQGEHARAELRSADVGEPMVAQVQMAPLQLRISDGSAQSDWSPVIDDGLAVESRNVAALYRRLLADLADGGHRVADATDAVRLHRMIERIAG